MCLPQKIHPKPRWCGRKEEKRKTCIRHPLWKGSLSANWFLWVFFCMATYTPYFINFTHTMYSLIFIIAHNCKLWGFICTRKKKISFLALSRWFTLSFPFQWGRLKKKSWQNFRLMWWRYLKHLWSWHQ